ncbi:hypothetical protein AB0B30_36665, partial [Streptomyces narbonensis]|uniref:hypothetical protein n=1 Tax=Streptomyces narbonensis TaxID=67333 RepID=UPI0033D0960C
APHNTVAAPACHHTGPKADSRPEPSGPPAAAVTVVTTTDRAAREGDEAWHGERSQARVTEPGAGDGARRGLPP